MDTRVINIITIDTESFYAYKFQVSLSSIPQLISEEVCREVPREVCQTVFIKPKKVKVNINTEICYYYTSSYYVQRQRILIYFFGRYLTKLLNIWQLFKMVFRNLCPFQWLLELWCFFSMQALLAPPLSLNPWWGAPTSNPILEKSCEFLDNFCLDFCQETFEIGAERIQT